MQYWPEARNGWAGDEEAAPAGLAELSKERRASVYFVEKLKGAVC